MAEEVAATPGRARLMLADDVYERTKAMLMDQVIQPGSRITIDGLAREFAVSQTPVREALARLESDDLVIKAPLRGYRATELLTPHEFEDLYEFRRLIEPWAAARAAERVGGAAREALEAELGAVTAPQDSHYDAYKALAAHDHRFHTLVAQLSGSDQVRRAFERTHCHMHVFRLRWDHVFGPQTLAEHRRIAEAVASGSPTHAHAAMVEHLDAGMRERLRDVFVDRGGATSP